MDPATMAVASIGLNAAGTGLDMYGKSKAAGAQAGMYAYQGSVARINQQIAKQNADYERYAGEVKAQQGGMETRARIGSMRAKQGASGLDVNRGSAVNVRAGIADVGAQNVGIIRANAARRAYAYESEAANYEAQGTMYDTASKNAKKAGKLAVLSSLISGASSVAGKWQAGSQSGLFGSSSSNPVDVGSAISWEA